MENEIEKCLAYYVLRSAAKILGSLTADHLGSFLSGASCRAVLTTEQFPAWRINGVLNSHAFFQDSFGIETKFQGWRRSIDMSLFSPDEMLSELSERAERWQLEFGVDKNECAYLYHYSNLPLPDRLDDFWPHLLKRPAMYCESVTGWGLYCFLIGMTEGGDWLSLPEIPRAKELLDKLSLKSERTYGNRFAAFRLHGTAWGVLEWGDEIETDSKNAE